MNIIEGAKNLPAEKKEEFIHMKDEAQTAYSDAKKAKTEKENLPPSSGGVGLNKMDVQSWYNVYQAFIMGAMVLLLWWPTHKKTTPFRWRWSIVLVSIFLSVADFVYFYALSIDGAMISIVSMVRRASVVVSFLFGALLFHEKNLKSKFVDLFLVILGLVFLWLGAR